MKIFLNDFIVYSGSSRILHMFHTNVSLLVMGAMLSQNVTWKSDHQ
jgi:hypothetical protein